ncbi:FkbM family methyltransferase [Candidatus Saccharibacteria bacterium]|nr:MAG: FkbM family methyltransferase [Candidatus Saccharibacteria bacterium]
MTEMVKARLNGKWDIILPEHRAARPEWTTGWEPERLDALESEIKDQISKGQTPVVYDIGTEEGDMTGLYAQWGASVHAFEPNPRVWPNIKAIWEANNLPPLEGFFVGFAAAKTDIRPENIEAIIDQPIVDGWPFCAHGEVIGDHGFRTIAERSGDTPSVRIDDYVSLTEEPPTIITMDVEGAEFEVLKGAELILEQFSPVVFISVHPEFMFKDYGTYEADMHLWLRQQGYTGRHFAYDHEHHWEYRKI